MSLAQKTELPKSIFYSRNSIYGIIVWFTLFALVVPYILIRMFGLISMMRYLPVIDLIANVLTNAGDETFHAFFNDVYDTNQNVLVDHITMNLINVLALSGVALTVIYEITINNKSVRRGMFIAIAMFIVTYILPTRLIGFVGQSARQWLSKRMGTSVKGRYGWFGMLVSSVFAFVLVMIEFYIITYLI